MRQVPAVYEIPRDLSFSRVYELFYISPETSHYNYEIVYDLVFDVIDDSLASAVKREVENQ